jgi:guanylate kinase
MIQIARRGVCLVLCAPSGGGKGTITEALLAREPGLHRSVSVTTRTPRPGEVDGVHYHFITQDAFSAAEQNGELLEWARVLRGTHGYGTPRTPVETALAAGEDMVFDIDWQGFRQMRERLPDDVVGVFILPPALDVLEQRLRARGGESDAEIDRRMRLARDEISHWREFDHVVINDQLDRTVDEVTCILHAARLATKRRVGLDMFVAGMIESEHGQTGSTT